MISMSRVWAQSAPISEPIEVPPIISIGIFWIFIYDVINKNYLFSKRVDNSNLSNSPGATTTKNKCNTVSS